MTDYVVEFDCPACGNHQHVGDIDLICGHCGALAKGELTYKAVSPKPKASASKLTTRQKTRLAMQIDRTAALYEPKFMTAAVKAFRADHREIAAILEQAKAKALEAKATLNLVEVSQAARDYLMQDAADKWRSVFLPYLRGMVKEQNSLMATALGIEWDTRNLDAEKWFQDYVMTFAQKATAQTAAGVQEVIAAGLQEGWGADKTGRQLDLLFQQYVSGNVDSSKWLLDRLPPWRSEMIARTETIRASNQGQIAQYQEWGVVEKEWFASPDACEFCLEMSGKVIGVGEVYFRQGDSLDVVDADGNPISMDLDYEDVNGPPLHPNCRCVVLPVLRDMGTEPVEPTEPTAGVGAEPSEEPEAIGPDPTKLPYDEAIETRRDELDGIHDQFAQAQESTMVERADIVSQQMDIDAGVADLNKQIGDVLSEMVPMDWDDPKREELREARQELINQRNELLAQGRALADRLAVLNKEGISLGFGDAADIAWGSVRGAKNFRAKLDSAMEFVQSVVGPDVLDAAEVNFKAIRGRANYQNLYKMVSATSHDGVDVLVHEIGHAIEYANPQIHKRAIEFLEARTAGESAQKLRKLFPQHGYRADEVVKPDKFITPYIGKIYRSQRTGELYSSEVISMGIQYLYTDPVKFANDDREMFEFIISVLRGWL